ncbi:MAG: PEP-CTERM sorting domain-containing protein [Parvularculaceae bacterium]
MVERVPASSEGEEPPGNYLVDEPVFPPDINEWAPPYIPPAYWPGIVVDVPTPAATEPPCDEKTNPECPPPPPPPPPSDVPEPATWAIIVVGLLASILLLGRRRRPPVG